jgi:hypothetical protein
MIELDIGWIMTEVAPLAESAIAMLLKEETRLLCTAIPMISRQVLIVSLN